MTDNNAGMGVYDSCIFHSKSLSSPYLPFLFPPPSLFPSLSPFLQLTRDKKMLDEKLQETQSALETEESKAKTEHRARLKLESAYQEVEEKLDRENAVSKQIVLTSQPRRMFLGSKIKCLPSPHYRGGMSWRRTNVSFRLS